jgi:RimJ/RimL family protein N-acetyltransferase
MAINGAVNVEIRSPFPLEDAIRIWTWLQPFAGRVTDDFSPKTLPEFLTHFRSMSKRAKTWGVYREGELGGFISFEKVSPVVGTAHCTFRKNFWGTATTVPAIQLAVAEMFEHCEKLSLPVMADNLAIISLLKKLGAVKEGILRAQTRRDGKPVDMTMMALFKPGKAE